MKRERITRRQAAAAFLGLAPLAAPPAAPAQQDPDLEAARQRLRAAAEKLAQHDLPTGIEPACHFRAK